MKAKAVALVSLVLGLLALFSLTSKAYVISDEIRTSSAITETVQNETLNTSKEVYIVLITQGDLEKSPKFEIYKKVKKLGYTPIFPIKCRRNTMGSLSLFTARLKVLEMEFYIKNALLTFCSITHQSAT
ncbi:MAG: hypothetical protein H0Z18_06250 [Thermococcus sp.]|uniref:hypothetical protein n=1 Tax=Thermococcus sp. TaxID=35749 RepID=UPI001D6099D1|nr:hypothetical protein [Thermococcus sp.]MBO8174843.1 hypothetical protein [Thermococcus sp.]